MSDFSQERLLRLFTKAPGAFWRHDVDVSLSAAVKMARFAQVAGVQSTFYLNPRSDFYNLFSREGRAAVDAIQIAGHRLGLHCDCRIRAVLPRVQRDRDLIEADYPGLFSDAVSFHMPGEWLLWRDFTASGNFESFENAYGSKWKDRYLSDSRREFSEGKERLISDDVQINLHPEHWFA